MWPNADNYELAKTLLTHLMCLIKTRNIPVVWGDRHEFLTIHHVKGDYLRNAIIVACDVENADWIVRCRIDDKSFHVPFCDDLDNVVEMVVGCVTKGRYFWKE